MTKAAVRRFGGLAALPFVTLVIPFVLLPIVARIATDAEVAALSVGNSVGAMAALMVAYGWPLTGPARVAHVGARRARRLYAESLPPRILLWVVSSGVSLIAVTALTPQNQIWLAGMAMVAGSLSGLSPSWFLVGRSQARLLALYDTMPRVIGGLLSVVLVVVTRDVIWYPVCLALSAVLGQSAFVVKAGAIGWLRRRALWRGAFRILRREGSAALAMVSGGLYSSATVALVAIGGSVQTVAVYGLADRLFKASLTAIVATANAVQGWVSEQDDRVELARRGRVAVSVLAVTGLVGGGGIAGLGPWATAWLFGARYRIDFVTSVSLGTAFLAVALSTAFGRLILVPFERVRVVTLSTIAGAAVGAPLIALGAAIVGVRGAAAGFAISEVLVLLLQSGSVWRLRRTLRNASLQSCADG